MMISKINNNNNNNNNNKKGDVSERINYPPAKFFW